MVILIKVLQVLIALSALIIIHEFGHFLFARIFGVRVEKFYLFMDAGGFRLFSTKHNKLIRKYFPRLANADTDFGIGWLPLGGYCKISGMVDESLDTAQLKGKPRQDEFRSKPAWQRLLIMSGGVLFNFIFAIILYISILATWGEAYISNRDTQIYVNELSYDMGFRNGDRILGIDGVYEENFGMLQAELARSNAEKVSVLRDGDTLDIYIDRSRISEILGTPGMFDVAVPFIIDSVSADSPNSGTGLLRGDHIVAIDGEAVEWLQDGRRVLAEHSNEAVDVLLLRSCGSAEQPADSICLTLSRGLHQAYRLPDQGLWHTGSNPCRFQTDIQHHRRLSQGPQAGSHPEYGGIQVRGQFHKHRPGLPFQLELVRLHQHPGPAVHNAGSNEPDSNTGTGRRTHNVHHLRDDNGTQAERPLPHRGPDHRNGTAAWPDVPRFRQRHFQTHTITIP